VPSALSPCPCGSETAYGVCCGPVVGGSRPAASALELMRSRYSAYALDELDHVFRTWHPRTRPASLSPDPTLVWTGLTVHGSGEDWVEFTAAYTQGEVAGALHERSRFEQRRGRWVYVDGEVSSR
jgi:SEC-C motif domain protein